MAASAQSPPGFESGSLGNVIRPVGKTTAPHPPHASTPHSTTATTTKPTPTPPWLNSAALTQKQMDDQATAEANASIAPQVTGMQQQQQNYDAQQKAYQAAMTGFYAALAPYMAGIQGHVSDAYNSAGATMGGIAQGYAGTLGASAQANADATTAALTRAGQTQAIPAAQAQANPGSALTDAFSATHGGIAGASFAEQGAAKAADAAQKPAIWAAQGRDSMTEAINKAVAGDQKYADQIKNIYATVPGLRDSILKQIQSAELDKAKYAADQKNTAFDQAYKTHEAALGDAKFNASQSNTAFTQKLDIAKLNAETQHWHNTEAISLARLANSKAKSGSASKINIGVSNLLGYLADSSGNPVAGKGGKVVYTDTLPGNLKKMLPAVTGSILNAQKQGADAGTAFKQITQANPTIPQRIVRGEVVRIYGADKVPAWMLPLPPGATPLPNTGAWTHANLPVAQKQFSNYVISNAKRYKVDPNAVLAVSRQEGFGGGIGDNNTSFGPFQLHIGGALPGWVAQRGADYAQHWAWSEQGWDYALKLISRVAGGKTGQAAVDAIVRRFERPANPGKESAGAMGAYGQPPA